VSEVCIPTRERGNENDRGISLSSFPRSRVGVHTVVKTAWKKNPVKRGYVDEAVHWRYSSARDYAGGESLLEVCRQW